MKAITLATRSATGLTGLAQSALPSFERIRSDSSARFSSMPAKPESTTASMNRPVTLKDGTRATISLLGENDSEDLRRFYDNLSSYSYIKGDRCSDRNPGVDHGMRLHEIAMGRLKDPLSKVIIVRADTGGASRIIGACMMDYSSDRCYPHRIVVADAAKMKGVGAAMKIAQIQLAQADGMVKMEGTGDAPPELEKLYLRASEELGLSCTRAPIQAWGFSFPRFYQLEIDLRPSCPAAPTGRTARP